MPVVCFQYKTSAEIEVELHKRLLRTKSGKPALRFFDASEMIGYQFSPKPDEATYCRKQDTPWECDGFEEYIVGLHTDPISGGKSCLVSPNSLTVIEDLYQWASKNNNGSLVEDELASAAAIAQGMSPPLSGHRTCLNRPSDTFISSIPQTKAHAILITTSSCLAPHTNAI